MTSPLAFRRLTTIMPLLTALIVALPATPDARQGLEYEVKAAFLYNIVNFVTWPADAFANPTDPIRICVVGPDPFGSVLDRTMEGGIAGTRAITVDRITDDDAVSRCSVVFVPRGDAARAAPIIRAAASGPVLTVGESPEFLSKGGMISFVIDGGRVRFDVNASTAAARGLRLSSRLLRVARNTTGTGS